MHTGMPKLTSLPTGFSAYNLQTNSQTNEQQLQLHRLSSATLHGKSCELHTV